MEAAEYQKIQAKCAKHIKNLAIALDGVVKAAAAGQDSFVRASANRAQACLSEVLDCVETIGDKELMAPLRRIDKALDERKDESQIESIEADLHEFQSLLTAKAHQSIGPDEQQLTYAGTSAN